MLQIVIVIIIVFIFASNNSNSNCNKKNQNVIKSPKKTTLLIDDCINPHKSTNNVLSNCQL